MPRVDSHEVKRIFCEAIELSGEARSLFLRQATAHDHALRVDVEELIAASESDPDFLGDPTFESSNVAAVAIAAGMGEDVGTVIGRYKLLQKIGESGFGVVYTAEQQHPVQRRVALKIIKLGMDTRAVVARFEQERQALAVMDHPNIARVLDAGATPTGRPYFVMDLVKGEMITTYCDRHRLGIRERLELFTQVGLAVQHAHTKGVIHRDLKPGNVLVTSADGRAVARVIDFGIAKAMEGRLTDKTLYTEFHQPMGTPAYMSPEQAEGSLDIDTRTDVYSLGVLLYELLTGATPLDASALRSADRTEMQRLIREIDPSKPSTRIARQPEKVAAIAASRQTDPVRLGTSLRGELDWIVMKALEKDRLRRYGSASELVEDIERHLRGEPVEAAPASAGYRVGKFIRRHRTGFIASAVVAVALVAATAVSIGFAVREAAARKQEAQERLSATRVSDFMNSMFAGIDPYVAQGRDVSVLQQMLDEAIERINRGELIDAPVAEFRIRAQIADSYRLIARFDRAEAALAPAVELYEQKLKPDDAALDRLLEVRAAIAGDAGRHDEASTLRRELIQQRTRLLGPDALDVGWVYAAQATGDELHGKHERAIECGLEALRIARQHDEPALIGNLHSTLSHAYMHLGKQPEALEHVHQALEHYRKAKSGGELDRAINMATLAAMLINQNVNGEAKALLEESYGILKRVQPRSDMMISTLINLAQIDKLSGDRPKAITRLREALVVCNEYQPEGSLQTALVLLNLGWNLHHTGELAASVDAFRQGDEVIRRVLGPTNGQRIEMLRGLAESLRKLDRFAEAADALRSRVDVLLATKQRPHAAISQSEAMIATCLARLGKYEEAERLGLQASDEVSKLNPSPVPVVQLVNQCVAEMYELWHTAEPTAGHDVQAKSWRDKLASTTAPNPPK